MSVDRRQKLREELEALRSECTYLERQLSDLRFELQRMPKILVGYKGPRDGNGWPHGVGEWQDEDGTVYKGSFFYGEMTGRGKMTYPNGDSFDGYFIKGLRNGDGVYRWADGSSRRGKFKEGTLVEWL